MLGWAGLKKGGCTGLRPPASWEKGALARRHCWERLGQTGELGKRYKVCM